MLLAILCLACLPADAQSYMFKSLEVKEGLPSNQINCIYKDSEGFMWFGTASGVARYDGYRFSMFHSDGDSPDALPDNFVDKILEDPEGRLWMRTGETGYTYFDRTTESFDNHVTDYLKQIGIEGIPQNMEIDREGSIWFYVPYKGCYRLRKGASRADALLYNAGLPDGNLTALADHAEGMLLAYDNGRMACVDIRQMTLKWMQEEIAQQTGHQRVEVFSLYVDSDDDIWLYGVPGVWIYTPATRQWKKLIEEDRQHVSTMVRSIKQDKNGHFWIGKDQEGIDIWDKQAGRLTTLTHQKGDSRSLPQNTILSLYCDADGLMWVGTYKKGVAYYDESIYKFGFANAGDVNCIEEGNGGDLWLGLNDGGLMRWNRATGQRKTFLHQGEQSLTANVIVSLLHATDDRLWIGTFWGGLDCYDGQRFVHYRHREGDDNSLSNNNVWTLAEDREGRIWIGTLGGGLQCLDPRTGRFTTYNTKNSNLASDYISSICVGSDDRLIVGTASSGILLLEPESRKATNLTGDRAGKQRFSNLCVNQLYEDSRGLIWIATRDGLNLYDPKRDHAQRVAFPQGDGISRFISGIVEDNNGTMWITAGSSVANIILTPEEGEAKYEFRFHLYDNKDGLQGSEFNQRAIKRLASGEIAVGGLYGISLFNPNLMKYNRTQPKVIFTGFRLFNDEVKAGIAYDGQVILKQAVNTADEVTLKYRQNVFTVLFASDNYVLPDKTTYLYRLEGFDNDWMTSTADLHRATYTNLAPGSYVLKVKAVNSDGISGTEEAQLRIIILPPFWMTTWAYLCYALLFIGLLCAAFYTAHRRERRKFRLRQQEADARKQEEVNQLKFRFFTNVSHELRTPLTLIISPLESMIKETEDEKQKSRLNLMYRNAQRLLNMVNQLLDFRKSEISDLHLNLSKGDIVSYTRNLCNSFLMLSEKKHVHLTFFSAMEYLNMSFDEDKIGKVVMNLLSNAFKFTPDGGRVDVALEMKQGTTDRLLIKVSDTGIGIEDEEKEHIFERFYQIEHGEEKHPLTGSGIGLSLVRDFVTLHDGHVWVVDNVERGSVFIVELPVRGTQTEMPGQKPAATEAGKPQPEELAPAEADPASDTETSPSDTAKMETYERKDQPLALIVDDNEDLVSFMKESLALYFRVRTASNGQEAWELVTELKPDIIVSDVMMPVMDGNELCRKIKEDKHTCNIPLILLTAKQNVEDKVESLTIGADDYVTKPFNTEVLILRMRKLVELSKKSKNRTQIDPEPSEIEITSLDEQLVANAIKYVEGNMARPELSVEELSQALGMSRVHLYKKLSQITGKSPTEFIRIIRLKRAAQLLRESQLNVSEIAYRVGFNNPKYFSKYFKEEFGVLPSAYQEKEGK